MIKTAVIGATGYAGAELVKILSRHPEVKITILTSKQYAGVSFTKIFPSMTGLVDIICQEFSIQKVCAEADVIFMALPHKLPMEFAPEIIQYGKKIIDLSADFRFNDVLKYEQHYQIHTAKHLIKDAVYGLCEIYYEKIKEAKLIGNPGCYPTSVLLPLIPLVKQKLIDIHSIIIDAKSGVSGAGRSLALTSHFCEVNESFKAYKVTSHRHTPEMEEILSLESGEQIEVTFTPHIVPMSRGMFSTIYANISDGVYEKEISGCLKSFYNNRFFIRIRDNEIPDTLHVTGTNYCDIGFKIDKRKKRIVLMSVIDNLVKGASGQAVQNMNIMMGFNETLGLL